MEDIVIVGFGGHAKSIIDSIERQGKYRVIGYTDFKEQDSKYKYLGNDSVLQLYYEQGVKYACVGIGYLGKGNVRQNCYKMLKEIGYELPIIVDPTALVAKSAILGEGTFIGKNVVVNVDVQIGKMVIVNSKALIEHECCIGAFSHVAVAAVLCGQVKVGQAAFVGANATVIQCMTVGEKSLIPAGAIYR